MATLTVTVTEDYRDGDPVIPVNTTAIVFVATPLFGATARFNSSQFGLGLISNTVVITGDANVNAIAVHTPSDSFFSAANWTFSTWSPGDRIDIFGTSAAETITGSSQQNLISGSGGADILTGGGSNDFFFYSSPSDIVAGETVNGNGGTDTIVASSLDSFDFSLLALTSIERLSIATGGSFATTATLSGAQIGAGGITEVSSGSGPHVLVVKGSSVNLDPVTFIDWELDSDKVTINGASGNDSLTGSSQRDTLNGGGNQDTLNGGAEADTLNGESGNDTLNGGAGVDALRGGLGNDTYVLGAENDTVTDTGGVDTVTSTVNRSISGFGSVEKLTLLGTAVTGTGNGLANTILGNAVVNVLNGAGGADTLNGGAAADVMRGGADNDTYIVDNIGDVVDESPGGSSGTDTVLSSVNVDLGGGTAKFVSLAPAASGLGAVENITLTGAAVEATGNAIANLITGNGAGNTLDGGDGADRLLGSAGNDRLIGGLGADQFTGGTGGDTFAFLALGESGKKTSARDTILDFTAEDFVDLSAIDAKKGGKDNKFKFIGKDAFDGNKGELRYQKKNGDVVVSADVNGDGKADLSILLDNLNKVAKADFVL